MYQDDFLEKKLAERKSQDAFRTLRLPNANWVDFCSNDYLGIVHNNLLANVSHELATGSKGSRLLAGNYALAEIVETDIAHFHESEAALLFNSGYDANLGLLSCVPQRGDTVIYDFLVHASIRDGIRLSNAQSFAFLHNNVTDLERRLLQATGNIFVVTETVFSMDGDMCPLPEIVALCQQYNAHLIVDEAHATGIVGVKGAGLVQHLQFQNQIFARVNTFGKACGCHGAVVLGSVSLRNYLINFARSFIYSTAIPPHAVGVIAKSYQVFPDLDAERVHLAQLIQQFQHTNILYQKLPSITPIQIVIIPGNEAVKKVAHQLQTNGFDVRAILYPTVPKNSERLRIVLHAFNTKAQVAQLLALLQ